jgi:hypothetical protein
MQATTKLWRPGILFLVAFSLLLGASPAASNEPTFTTIDVPGAVFTWTVQINAVGDMVGYYFDGNGVGHGFLLSRGNFTTIDVPGAVFTLAFGINPAGEIVGF